MKALSGVSCALRAAIYEDMKLMGCEGGLLGYEVVKKVHIESVPWTVNDLLTDTQKLKRLNAKMRYLEVISKLYMEASF